MADVGDVIANILTGITMTILSPVLLPAAIVYAVGATVVELTRLSVDSIREAIRKRNETKQKATMAKLASNIRHNIDSGNCNSVDVGLYDSNWNLLETKTYGSQEIDDSMYNMSQGDVIYVYQ